MPRKAGKAIPKATAKSIDWMMNKNDCTTFEIEGLENNPAGSNIFAQKHQSYSNT